MKGKTPNTERRTSNAERRPFHAKGDLEDRSLEFAVAVGEHREGLRFDVGCSVFDVRCFLFLPEAT